MKLSVEDKECLDKFNPLEIMLWKIGEQGVPCCLMKIQKEISFEDFAIENMEINMGGDGEVIIEIYFGEFGRNLLINKSIYKFSLYIESDLYVLKRLCHVKCIRVYLYEESKLLLLGFKEQRVNPKTCNSLLDFIHTHLEKNKVGENGAEKAKDNGSPESKAYLGEEDNFKYLFKGRNGVIAELPTGWKKKLFEAPQRIVLLNFAMGMREPCLLVLIPPDTGLKTLSVSMQSILLSWYRHGHKKPKYYPILNLSFILYREGQGKLPMQKSFDLPKDLEKILQLTYVSKIFVIFVADNEVLSVIGAVSLVWREELKEQAKKSYMDAKAINPLSLWQIGLNNYNADHLPERKFQKSGTSLPREAMEVIEIITVDQVNQNLSGKQPLARDYFSRKASIAHYTTSNLEHKEEKSKNVVSRMNWLEDNNAHSSSSLLSKKRDNKSLSKKAISTNIDRRREIADHLKRAESYFLQKKYKEASEYYTKAIELDKNLVSIYHQQRNELLYRGKILFERRFYEDACLFFDSAIQFDANFKDAYLMKAQILEILGRQKDADAVRVRASLIEDNLVSTTEKEVLLSEQPFRYD